MSDALQNNLSKATHGYQSKEEYKRKREDIQQAEAMQSLRRSMGAQAESSSAGEERKKDKSKKKKKQLSALSFDDELDGEGEPSPTTMPKKMGKCQDVDVSFLKKNTGEVKEAAEQQEQAMRDFLVMQQKAKSEEIQLEYTFRSEVTQRELQNGVTKGSVTVTRGSSAEEVARVVARDVEKMGGPKFKALEIAGVREERDVMLAASVASQSIGLGAGFIIPPSNTLVEIGMKRWTEGASLFDDFKGGVMVTERRWYEEMKHTFPYSQWNTLDMATTYSHIEFIANRDRGQGVDPTVRLPRDLDSSLHPSPSPATSCCR